MARPRNCRGLTGVPMREIEIRRHSCTKKGPARGSGSHLSGDGVALAREVSLAMGPYDLVLTSPTCPVHWRRQLLWVSLSMNSRQSPPTLRVPQWQRSGTHDRWTWETPWVRFFEMIDTGGPVTRSGGVVAGDLDCRTGVNPGWRAGACCLARSDNRGRGLGVPARYPAG